MGSWFSFDDMKIGQGRENAKNFLRENPDIREKIVDQVKKFIGLDKRPESNEDP